MPTKHAEWEAGVTSDHSKFRITINGEPLPAAAAASESLGWVDVVAAPNDDDTLSNGRKRLYGTVRIVRDASDR